MNKELKKIFGLDVVVDGLAVQNGCEICGVNISSTSSSVDLNIGSKFIIRELDTRSIINGASSVILQFVEKYRLNENEFAYAVGDIVKFKEQKDSEDFHFEIEQLKFTVSGEIYCDLIGGIGISQIDVTLKEVALSEIRKN